MSNMATPFEMKVQLIVSQMKIRPAKFAMILFTIQSQSISSNLISLKKIAIVVVRLNGTMIVFMKRKQKFFYIIEACLLDLVRCPSNMEIKLQRVGMIPELTVKMTKVGMKFLRELIRSSPFGIPQNIQMSMQEAMTWGLIITEKSRKKMMLIRKLKA